jgi:hypothetical protein
MFKVSNQSVGRVVINSLNIILSANGTKGDSVLIQDDKKDDKDIVSLSRSGILSIKKASKEVVKGQSKKAEKAPLKAKKDTKTSPSGGPDGKGNRAVFVSAGKVKTGKMVQSIEQGGDLPDPLTVDDQRDNDKKSDAFI